MYEEPTHVAANELSLDGEKDRRHSRNYARLIAYAGLDQRFLRDRLIRVRVPDAPVLPRNDTRKRKLPFLAIH